MNMAINNSRSKLVTLSVKAAANVTNTWFSFNIKTWTLLFLCVYGFTVVTVDGSLGANQGDHENRPVMPIGLSQLLLKNENPQRTQLLSKLIAEYKRLNPSPRSTREQAVPIRTRRSLDRRDVSFDKAVESQYYTRLIFWYYGDTSEMSLEDFDALLAHIGLKEMTRFANETTHDHSGSDHDHDHSHGHHHDDHDGHDHVDDEDHDHEDHDDEGHDHEGHDHEGHEHEGHDHEGHDHEGHDHEGHGHDHDRRRRDTGDSSVQINNGTDGGEEEEEQPKCLTSSDLLYEYGLDPEQPLTHEDFQFLCPALIYQLDQGVCVKRHGHEEKVDTKLGGLVWVYAMVSVLVISLCALFGILCIPRRGGNENIVMQFLIALAMASMSGDGMLHLIPHAMVPHGEHDEGDGHDDGHLDSLYKGLVALIGIYVFFFLERSFAIVKTVRESKRRKSAGVDVPMVSGRKDLDDHDGHGHSHDSMFSCTSLAMMIIVGDMFHNFCDGLAIGAAFAGSLSVGLSTSIAVFCHELPHEIGDFAVLITSGMSAKRAIAFNLLSTVPCFLGAAIGLELGSLGDLALWIFVFVGGLFLYISLVNLVPEMTRAYAKPNAPWVSYLLVHLGGMTLGVIIMLLLGIYEDDLQNILT